jgi:hypothetical protein
LPRVSKNLLSIGAIVDMGYGVMFGVTNCWIISTKSPHKLIVKGRTDPTNGLYKLTMEVILNIPTSKINALFAHHKWKRYRSLGPKDGTHLIPRIP